MGPLVHPPLLRRRVCAATTVVALVAVVGAVGCAGGGTGGGAHSEVPRPDSTVERTGGRAPAVQADVRAVVRTLSSGARPAVQRAALARYLAGRGVTSAAIATLMHYSRVGIGLFPTDAATGTRTGGQGVVPAGQRWPSSPDGYPLQLIAVIDLAGLPRLAPLPHAGRLVLYYDSDPSDPHFLDPVAAARAYYLPPGAPTSTLHPPYPTRPPSVLYFRGQLMSFFGEAQHVIDSTPKEHQQKLIAAMNDVMTTTMQPTHLLGNAYAIQSPPLDELIYAFNHPNKSRVRADSLTKYTTAERHDPSQWVLLAEVDEERNLTIADGGALYYAIPRIDLAHRRFDRVAVVMDSH